MKSRRFLTWALATGLCLASAPLSVHAQTTGGTGATSSGGLSAGGNTTTTASTGGQGTQGGQGGNNALSSGIDLSASNLVLSAISSGKGSATASPSNVNPFVGNYVDYLTPGMPSKYSTGRPSSPTGTFGKGIYTTTTTSTSSGSKSSSTATQAIGFSTWGTTPRAPLYTTVLASDIPIVIRPMTQVEAKVRAAIDRSSFIKNKGGITMSILSGGVVQLQGTVGTEKERTTAEGIARMEPGVRDVQNNLSVQTK